eukprot:TRINITY_DN312_c0_g1_i1.p1 TRINITY_DN312_c0_g1~~TRINITY_DN312_c0_g1_i1.p1  ORF type:complete len:830 (+),score=252.30 TRINITY_DN312_c0_g1_i1:300-2789(+)
MEGRKRKSLATSSDELSSSKKMKEDSEEENPLDPTVLTFQNAAMSVRIEEYKNEINALQQRIESLNAKQSAFDKIISTVNKQWDMLNDNLNLFMIRIGKGEQVADQSGSQRTDDNPPSFLDLLLRTESKGFSESTSYIEEALQKRNNFTKDVLLKLGEALEEARTRSSEFIQKLASAVGKDESAIRELVSESLTRENERLNKQIRECNIREGALQNSYQNLKEDVEALKESKLSVEQKNKELRTECDDAIVKLELAQRRAERYRLAVEQGGPGFLRLSSSTSSLKNSGSLTSSSSSNSIPPATNGTHPTTEEQKTLEAEVKDARELAESRLQEIQKLREGRTTLLKDLNRLRQELAVIPDERIFKSHLCQMLQHQAQTATAELMVQRQQVDRLQRDLQSLAAQHRQAVEKFEVEEVKRREPVEKELRESKALIANLKNEINELNFRLERTKTLQPNEKLIGELKNLLQTQEKQIKKLTQDCDRYRADSQQLKILKKEFKEMEDKLVDLLEQKEQEHSLALEELSVLKSKSTQGTNSDDAKTKAPSESALAIELEHMRKKLARLEETIAEQKASLDSQQKEADLLMTEIETISKAYDEMHDTSSRLATQITEKEDINTQLLAERVKLKQIVDIQKQEKQLLQDKFVKLDEKCVAQAEFIQKLETQHRTLQDAHYKTVDELKAALASVDGHKRLCRETSQASGEMRVQIDHLKGMLDDLRKQSLDSTVALEKEQNKYLRLEEERNALKKKLDRLESRTPQADSLVEEELKMLKKQMRCPVCNDNNKNAVIAKCYHCFCRPCIQKNLDCRSRKCPACKKPFGESDVHSIWLE